MKQHNIWQSIVLVVVVLLVCSLCGYAQASASAHTADRQALLLDIKGPIGPATQDFVRRGFKQAKAINARVVMLRIDTPGGLSKSMRLIIQDILASPVPVLSYVAPSGARAASAGTYILYASHVAAMAPGTNLGAATPVNMAGPSQPKDKAQKDKQPSASEKKAVNDARAYLRSLAQLRQRNVQWAEKAVTEGESLSSKEALKLNVINFIANNLQDVLQKANGMQVDVAGKMERVESKGLAILTIEPDWRNKFLAVITSPSVAYILLMIGVYGIFFEFFNPGFIVPGVVGAIALLIALYSFQLLPVNYAGLALMGLGLAFIAAEIFMPSFGVLGIGGIISFALGSVLMFKTGAVGFSVPIYLIIGVTVVTAGFVLLVLSMALRSRKKPVVSGEEALLNCTGVVEIISNQVYVRVKGERWQCQSKAALQSGQKVIVKSIEGLTLNVEPLSTE